MAPGAVGAKYGVKGLFESRQRLLFVETFRSYEGFDVGSTASVRKLGIPEFLSGCGWGFRDRPDND
jgi:hypothetical protein